MSSQSPALARKHSRWLQNAARSLSLKSLRTPEHVRLTQWLIAAREKARLTQQELADRLGRHQSFVAKYEGGERRIDVIEFLTIARALGFDPARAIRKISGETSAKARRH